MDYVIAQVEARPATEGFAPILQAPYDALSAALVTRNQATTAHTKLVAKRDVAWNDVVDALEPFLLRVQAHYGSKTAPGVGAIFALTVAQYGALPLKDFPDAIGKLAQAVKDPATPSEVQSLAAPFLDAHHRFSQSLATLDVADLAKRRASTGVVNAKQAVLDGNARIRAELASLFPRQPKTVARFFPRDKQPKAPGDAESADVAGGSDDLATQD